MGLSWQGQNDRIRRDLVLSEVQMSVRVTRTDIEEGSRRPHTSEMLCLPLDYLNGWLFGINASRVKAGVRERLLRYQRECYKVLAEAFREGRLTADSTFEELLATADEGLVQAYQMAQAIVQLARNQILLDGRMSQAENRLDNIEAQLGHPDHAVTPDQASQISQAVKAVAIALGKKTSRNEFGSVYGELYRRYGLTSYKLLPARQFEDAMTFLTEWHQGVITDTAF
jgi:hypothetical protein